MKIQTPIVAMAAAMSLAASTVLAAPSGVAEVKWLEGERTAEDFADAGTVLTEPYQITTEENGKYTIYAVDKAGNAAIKTVTVDISKPNDRPSSGGSSRPSGGGSSGGSHGGSTVTITVPADEADKPPETTEQQGKTIRYIKGYPDGTFHPDNAITRAEVVTILARLLQPETAGDADFPDIAGHWAKADIARLDALGHLKGYEDGTFHPDNPITRAEAAALICRAFDNKLTGQKSETLPDIAGHWAAEHICQLAGNGYLNGYPDGTFRPDNAITRAEVVKLINAVIGNQPDTQTPPHFTDVPAIHWAFGDVGAAAE